MTVRVNDYQTFLASKRQTVALHGKEVSGIHPMLYPFQAKLVEWACRKGRAAIFADCGLGKTLMQLEWARLMGVKTLILAPLAVAQQTIAEGQKIGVDVQYARSQEQATGQITIANYEMLDHFNPAEFGAVVLDESSILKSFDGKTRTRLIETFKSVPYRLCCTATPAPNDLEEFGNHAEFLGICSRRDMLSNYFVHKDDGWHIKGHAVEPFYRWLASWGMLLRRPSDLGFDDNGFILPQLSVEPLWVNADSQAIAQAEGRLLPAALSGIKGRLVARRSTIADKVKALADLVNDGEQWIIWCGLNDEGRESAKAIPGSLIIEGADSIGWKVQAIQRFVAGDCRVLVTKAKISGFGLNLQNCHNQAFLGISDSYETYYQCIRRSWRFGQQKPVNVRVILSDIEAPVLENVLRKEAQADDLSEQMVKAIAGYERNELGMSEEQAVYQTSEARGVDWRMMSGDCVERCREIPDNSIDFSVFSPPFLNLYSYTDSERDMGNTTSPEDFFAHFGYLTAELLRVTKTGRLVGVHVAQVPTTLVNDGVIGMKDFRGRVIQAYEDSGFVYHGEVCIDKDPQAQAIRTHSKGLLFVQLRKDASWLRPAMADYVLFFRKPGENAVPIHPDLTNDEWIQWARPIWYGIRESDTLSTTEARTEKDEKHICPLQLGTIERCIRLWSNPGETVLSPFAGIGSEGYEAVRLGRKFVGIELKPEYFNVACKNLDRAVTQKTQQQMF